MARRLNLKGGEMLSKVPNEVLTNSLVDTRYYPFKGTYPENVSTDYAEYQEFDADTLTGNTVNIEVNPSSRGYRDLKNSYIVANYRLIDGDTNTPIQYNEFITEPLTSLLQFSDVRTWFDSKQVSDDHDRNYPWAAFHRTTLENENVACPMSSSTVGYKTLYEDVYDVGNGGLYNNATNTSLNWKKLRYPSLDPNNFGINCVVHPRDGIWQQNAFIPSSVKLRMELTKATPSSFVRRLDGQEGTNVRIQYSQITLFLRVVYPTQATEQSVMSRALAIPRQYPVLRTRTDSFTVLSGSNSIKLTNVLSGSKPNALVVHIVPEANRDNFSRHPFERQIDNEMSVSELFIRIGNQRLPRNWSYGGDEKADGQGAAQYNEYVSLCKTVQNSNEKQLLPFIPSDQKNFQIYHFNCRQNQESIWNRADDDTGLDTIQIEGRFHSTLTENCLVYVTALSNDVITISPSGVTDIEL